MTRASARLALRRTTETSAPKAFARVGGLSLIERVVRMTEFHQAVSRPVV